MAGILNEGSYNVDFDKIAADASIDAQKAAEVVTKAKAAKKDNDLSLLSFKDESDYKAFLKTLSDETNADKKIELYRKFLNEKFGIKDATAPAARAVVAEADAKRTLDELIKAFEKAPDAKTLEAAITEIRNNEKLSVIDKRVTYVKMLQFGLFGKGYGYRFDEKAVYGPSGKDEDLSKEVAKIPESDIMFAMNTHLYGIYKTAINDPKRLEQAILTKYKLALTSNKDQNVVLVAASNLPQPEKSWLISFAEKPESVKMKEEDSKLAQSIHGDQDRADASIRQKVKEVAPGITDPFPRSKEEYARDPSLYMTDAIKALGPVGIIAGIFTLIFSDRVFSNKWTGGDLVAKLGASFLGLKLAGKVGLGTWVANEATGKTTHTVDTAKAAGEGLGKALDWSWGKLKLYKDKGMNQAEEVAKSVALWYYMSNYSVMENGQKINFMDAKVKTLDGLDPNNTNSLGIQKENGTKPVEKSDISKAKTMIDDLKAKRLANLKAEGKADPVAATQLATEMQQNTLTQFIDLATKTTPAPQANPTSATGPAPVTSTTAAPAQPVGTSNSDAISQSINTINNI